MEKSEKQLIKGSESWDDLVTRLQSIGVVDFNSREIDLILRTIHRVRSNSDIKIAFLSNHTIDLLPNYLSVYSTLENLKIESYVAPYNQYFQSLLADSSDLLEFEADVIYLDLSIPNLSVKVHSCFLELDDEQKDQELNKVIEVVQQLSELVKQKTNATLLVSNFVQPSYPQAGIADFQLSYGEVEWYTRLNLALIELFRKDTRTFVVDKHNVLARMGKLASRSSKMYYIAKMELNEQALAEISKELIRYIKAIKGLTKKCLVLDLDNTLWGGVVGEDGINGIKLGKGFPEGEVYYDLQTYYRSLKQRGIILAIASKNNAEDAEEVFKEKQDMPLHLDDFAIRKINWNTKNQSLGEIARALNIGEESMVFIDDNPVERELIRNSVKDVAVPELPVDPAGYLPVVQQANYFEKLFLTVEDISKLEQYQQNAQREELKSNISDINTFLSNLGTVLQIEIASDKQIPRIHQLFTKTNQFNLTTHRYGISDIEKFIANDEWTLVLFSVADNFGDMGIIGLVLLEGKDKSFRIDSFILSCRAMGRGIETAVMNSIKKRYLLDSENKSITAKYLKSKKNKPAESFYEQQGFLIKDTANTEIKDYVLAKSATKLLTCPDMIINFDN